MIATLLKIPTKIGQLFLQPKMLLGISLSILLIGLYLRIDFALSMKAGGDDYVHQEAIEDLLSGKNPYQHTVDSYENLEESPGSKGYAYFPAILYVYTLLYKVSLLFPQNSQNLMLFFYRLPGIIGYLGVGLFFIFYFLKKDRLAMVFCILYWVFNYHFVGRGSLARFDDLPVLFLLLALYQLGKSDVKSGIFYSLAVLFKTFPVILFPLFMFKAKKPLKFLFWGFLVAGIFSIPFMKSIPDFLTYIRGALLVHGDRFVQGRPFLYYLSYATKIEFFQIIPFSFYSLGSIFSGWIILLFSKYKKRINDQFTASVLPFASFYLIAPVLNRTFLIWWIPFLLIGLYNYFTPRNKPVYFYILASLVWLFLYWYLDQWSYGFHDMPILL